MSCAYKVNLFLALFLSFNPFLWHVVEAGDKGYSSYEKTKFQRLNLDETLRPELALSDIQIKSRLPSSIGGPDLYGYTWSDSVSLDWKGIISSGEGSQVFPSTDRPDFAVDDEVSGPISIGFNFKFYENEYSDVYISSNGLIGFTDDFAGNLAGASNLDIPFDYRIPQNFLAPFWDDLIIGGEYNSGKVAYSRGSDARGKFFVVEWSQVTKTNLLGSLSFEAVLYESGDILFQYQAVSGDLDSATIGIEDSDGVDGLAYVVNALGLSSNQTILFNRPPTSYRVKLFPLTSGALNINNQSIQQVVIRNTGEFGDDVYDLMVSSNPPGWQVILLDDEGNELLDTDGDGFTDTGVLPQNGFLHLNVKVLAPAWAVENSSVSIGLEAISSRSISTSQLIELRSALPMPFAITYRRGLNVYLELISRNNHYRTSEFSYYAGGSFGMAQASLNNFVGVSLVSGGGLYTNLEYMMASGIGSKLFETPRLITENSSDYDVRDNAPVVVVAPNGNISVAWIRRITRISTDFRTNINVFLTILDPSGKNFLTPEINVTQNLSWANTEDADLLEFEGLRIEAVQEISTGEDRFHLTWIEKHTHNTGLITTDVAHAVYTDVGGSVKAAGIFNFGQPVDDKIDYFEPSLISYDDDQLLLMYFVSDANELENPIDSLVFARLDSNGNILQSQTHLYDVIGEEIDGVQLGDGRVGVVWTNSENAKVNAFVFNSDLSKPLNYLELENPDKRPCQAVSITQGADRQAILTWMDGGLLERMYYAVMNSSGEILVDPLAFKYRDGDLALETVSNYGNAEYIEQWANYLPVINK